MQLRITQVNGVSTERYPYTHRIEFSDPADTIQPKVKTWLDEMAIPAIVIPYLEVAGSGRTVAVYVNEQDVALFALKWS